MVPQRRRSSRMSHMGRIGLVRRTRYSCQASPSTYLTARLPLAARRSRRGSASSPPPRGDFPARRPAPAGPSGCGGARAPLRSPPGTRYAPVTSGPRLLGDGARASAVPGGADAAPWKTSLGGATCDLQRNPQLAFHSIDGDLMRSEGAGRLSPIDGGRSTHGTYEIHAASNGPVERTRPLVRDQWGSSLVNAGR